MPAITAPGVGSGLDINSLVDKLVALEKRPLQAVQRQKSDAQAQLSSYGKFKNVLSDFRSAMSALSTRDSFQLFAASSSNENSFDATTGADASGGSHAIDVTSLATRHKLASSAFADSTAVVGEGTLTLSNGVDSFDVTIDASNNTLAGIRDAINSASDNTGVSATILTDDAGTRLIMTARDSGTANAIQVSVSGDSQGSDSDNIGLSQLVFDATTRNLSEVNAASDAELSIDGFSVTSASNIVSGALQGVTLNLHATGSGTLDIATDTGAIKESAQSFVDAFNNLRATISDLRKGNLEADSTLLSVENLVLGQVNTKANINGGNFDYLTQVGVEIDRYGKMSLNAARFEDALNSDFDGVSKLFSDADGGIARRLDGLAGGILATGGLLDARESGLNDQIKALGAQADRIDRRLVSTEVRLRARFTAMDSLVANLNATGSYLSQQLSGLASLNKR